MKYVYVLYHTRFGENDYEDVKCLGVFSSIDKANQAKQYALTQKGFKDYPDNFDMVKYEIDKQEWIDGFGD